MIDISLLDFSKYSDRLIPTIVQHSVSNKVLMLGFSSPESLMISQRSKKATFFSRSKNTLWTKGESSGHFLYIQSIQWDCDADTLLFFCLPDGPTCHTGSETCFTLGQHSPISLATLWDVYNTIDNRKKTMPTGSYVASLFSDGLDRIIQKVGEEAIETVIAAKNEDEKALLGEFSDLLFHMLVLLHAKNIPLEKVLETLHHRKR